MHCHGQELTVAALKSRRGARAGVAAASAPSTSVVAVVVIVAATEIALPGGGPRP